MYSPEFQSEAAPIVRRAGKVALILAAGDYRYKKPDGSYVIPEDWIQKDTEYIEALGGTAEYLDFRTQDIDPEKLIEFGGFWVGGGNVFILAQRLRESVIGREIKMRHEQGTLIYVAESAGAVVAADSMKYIWEVPSFLAVNTEHFRQLIQYNKAVGRAVSGAVGISAGLNLTDVKIVPHQDTTSPPQHVLWNNEGLVYLRDGDYYSHAHKKTLKSVKV